MRRGLWALALAALLCLPMVGSGQQEPHIRYYSPGARSYTLGPQGSSITYSQPSFRWYLDTVGGADANNCQSAVTACQTLAAVAGKAGYAVTDRIGALIGGAFVLAPPATGIVAWYTGVSLTGAEGDAIGTWVDSSGAGYDATQATGANKPALTYEAFDSLKGVAFNGGSKWLGLPVGLTLNSRNVTVLIAARSPGVVSTNPTHVTLSNVTLYFTPVSQMNATWNATGKLTLTRYVPTGTSVHGVTGTASAVTFHNPRGDTTDTAWAASDQTGNRLGGYPGLPQNDFYGVYGDVILATAMDAATLSAARAYLSTKYGASVGPYTAQVCYVGNSLTAGTKSTNGGSYPAQLSDALPSTVVNYNVGRPSITTTEMIAEGATRVDAFYDAALSENVVVAWEVRNDIVVGGKTAAQAYANYVTYCQARQAAGWSVVAVTVLPSASLGDADRASVNASIRANWATFADALADIAADSRIGDNGDNADATYYNADLIHMTNAGYGVVAEIVEPEITALLP
jgi:lysophospholipase L1-like esterase